MEESNELPLGSNK